MVAVSHASTDAKALVLSAGHESWRETNAADSTVVMSILSAKFTKVKDFSYASLIRYEHKFENLR